MSESCLERLFPETRFGGFSPADGAVAFYLRVNALLKSDDIVLDVGCGRGAHAEDSAVFRRNLRILKGKACKVIGLDPDPSAAQNPFLDEFRRLASPESPWPVPDESIDLIVSDWTLEHVAYPDLFFSEVQRALKRGGYFCARTANAWGMVGLASRLFPPSLHTRILQRIQRQRQESDIFPTAYACNTIPLLKKKLAENNLSGAVIGFAGVPGYFLFSCLAARLAYLYERCTFPFLRHTLMIFAQKK